MPKKTKTPVETRPSIPMPARVEEDEEFQPVSVSLEGKTLAVVSIDGRAEEEAEWWEPEPVYKDALPRDAGGRAPARCIGRVPGLGGC